MSKRQVGCLGQIFKLKKQKDEGKKTLAVDHNGNGKGFTQTTTKICEVLPSISTPTITLSPIPKRKNVGTTKFSNHDTFLKSSICSKERSDPFLSDIEPISMDHNLKKSESDSILRLFSPNTDSLRSNPFCIDNETSRPKLKAITPHNFNGRRFLINTLNLRPVQGIKSCRDRN